MDLLLRIPVAFVTLFLLDMAWFAASSPLYASVVTKRPINRIAAAAVWLLLALAVAGQRPRPTRWTDAAAYGSLVGLVVYGVYNGTNYAILADWPIHVALADTAWGCVVCGAAAVAVHFAATALH